MALQPTTRIVQLFMCGVFVILAILIIPFKRLEINVISIEFLAANRRRLSLLFAHSSGSK